MMKHCRNCIVHEIDPHFFSFRELLPRKTDSDWGRIKNFEFNGYWGPLIKERSNQANFIMNSLQRRASVRIDDDHNIKKSWKTVIVYQYRMRWPMRPKKRRSSGKGKGKDNDPFIIPLSGTGMTDYCFCVRAIQIEKRSAFCRRVEKDESSVIKAPPIQSSELAGINMNAILG